MLRLACRAVAELAVQGLLSTQLVFDLAAVAARFVAGLEVFIGIVHAVRGAELPLVLGRDGLLALGFVRIHVAVKCGSRSKCVDCRTVGLE